MTALKMSRVLSEIQQRLTVLTNRNKDNCWDGGTPLMSPWLVKSIIDLSGSAAAGVTRVTEVSGQQWQE